MAGSNPESYTYDAVGNRLTSQTVSNYSYNSSNELTAAGSASYTYDNNGNTLSDAQGRSYTWDFENRLTQVVNPGVGTTTFKYDPFGRRIQKNGASVTNYVYDGSNVLEEVDSSGNLLAKYSQGVGIDEPLSETRSGSTSFYEQDGLSSVTSLSTVGGALANTYTYGSFGNLAASTGTITNSYQYTGRDYDPETGLRYYRARYYDSNTGRFISEDPIQFEGGENFYRYADNDPVDFADPQGLSAVPNPKPLPVPAPLPPGRVIAFPNPAPEYGFCARFPMLCALWMPFIPMNGGEDPQRVRCATELYAPGCAYGHPVPDPNSTNAHPTCEKSRCDKIRQECTDRCWEKIQPMRVPSSDKPQLLRKCIRECMALQGCENF